MTDRVAVTDRINEILTEYDGLGHEVQLNDIDSWSNSDIQELLAILDNEVANRCNEASAVL